MADEEGRCRKLWAAIMLRALNDASCATGARREEQAEIVRKAQAWIGTRDFHACCALAGLNGVAVAERFRAGAYQPTGL